MKALGLTAVAWLSVFSGPVSAATSPADQLADIESIATVLDEFHDAAATGDWVTYFDLMSDDAVFIGTDASERWTKEVFRAYASNSNGWIYVLKTRNINLTPSGDSAWFDEILISKNYGTSRGTGILIHTDAGWKIAQYHLTFPIPNDLAYDITDRIKRFENEQVQR
ncbi:MAG: nuclear transport factor 2 family protein [Gammaproteobacteria bacterium]|nr:nuclear transport factor 2 family protein [Gammaproteobacteria bacterium]